MKNSANLDLMRSFAVLSVVAAHAFVYTGREDMAGWSGITGVCMFFVHTSLVLMFSLERDQDAGHFYLRRIFRIYPLWLMMIGIICVFHLPQFPPDFVYTAPTWRKLLSNVLLLNNIDPHQEIVGAGWTLPIEVDMYLFLPVLFYFARSTRRIWPLLAFDLFFILYDRGNLPAHYSALPMCVPYFLPGIMAFVLWKQEKRKQLPGWLFPLFLIGLLAWDHHHGSFRRDWVFCLVLGLALPHFREIQWKPVQVAAHYVAKYSYGIYLTHITALMVYAHVLEHRPMGLRLAAMATLLVVPAVLLYHLVEEPMIRLGARLARWSGGRRVPRVTEQSLNLEPAP